MLYAHVFAWETKHRQQVPSGLQLCHKCDNPRCCNPTHMFPGTFLDNMKDKISKGRVPYGEKHFNAKLSNSDVLEIKGRLLGGERQCNLARKFNVCAATICDIAQGRKRLRA